MSDDSCSESNLGTCVYSQDTLQLLKAYWEPITVPPSAAEPTVISSDTEGSRDNLNTFLKVTPASAGGSGVRTSTTARVVTDAQSDYILTLRMRSQQDGQVDPVALTDDGAGVKEIGRPRLTTGWQTITLPPSKGLNGSNHLAFTTIVSGEPVPFYIDDISFTPALHVNGPTYLTESCRLYPNENAPECNYLDTNGIQHNGLKGFCLERDPSNASRCISWWPVDILSGENIFDDGNDQAAGYNGRVPIYACTEAFVQNNPDEHLLRSHVPSINDGGKFIEAGAHGTCDSDSSIEGVGRIFPLCGTPYGPYRVMTTAIIGGVDNDESCGAVEERGDCREKARSARTLLLPGGGFGWRFSRPAGRRSVYSPG